MSEVCKLGLCLSFVFAYTLSGHPGLQRLDSTQSIVHGQDIITFLAPQYNACPTLLGQCLVPTNTTMHFWHEEHAHKERHGPRRRFLEMMPFAVEVSFEVPGRGAHTHSPPFSSLAKGRSKVCKTLKEKHRLTLCLLRLSRSVCLDCA